MLIEQVVIHCERAVAKSAPPLLSSFWRRVRL